MKNLIKRIFNGKRYKNGEVYIDTIVKVIICVVVGALLLTSIYATANSALNSARNKVNNLFNVNDAGDDIGGEGDISVPDEPSTPEELSEPELPQLTAPSISIDGSILRITEEDGNSTSYELYIDSEYIQDIIKSESISVEPGEIADLTGTTWEISPDLVLPEYYEIFEFKHYNINFISNEQSFSKFSFVCIEDEPYHLYFDFNYNGPTEVNVATIECGTLNYFNTTYKTISIIDGTDVNNTDLITWLESNATLIDVPATFDLSALSLSEGTHTIQCIAKASGYLSSPMSEAEEYEVVAPSGYAVTVYICGFEYGEIYYKIDDGIEQVLWSGTLYVNHKLTLHTDSAEDIGLAIYLNSTTATYPYDYYLYYGNEQNINISADMNIAVKTLPE